jgi:hypothetical protein
MVRESQSNSPWNIFPTVDAPVFYSTLLEPYSESVKRKEEEHRKEQIRMSALIEEELSISASEFRRNGKGHFKRFR